VHIGKRKISSRDNSVRSLNFRLGEKFRVYIVLPLLPGFDNINAVQAVLYFIMCSITKGDGSLFKRLEKAGKLCSYLFFYFYIMISGVPPNDYISFFGMRGHDILMGRLVCREMFD